MVRIFRDVHIRSIYISIDVAVHAGGLKSNFDVHRACHIPFWQNRSPGCAWCDCNEVAYFRKLLSWWPGLLQFDLLEQVFCISCCTCLKDRPGAVVKITPLNQKVLGSSQPLCMQRKGLPWLFLPQTPLTWELPALGLSFFSRTMMVHRRYLDKAWKTCTSHLWASTPLSRLKTHLTRMTESTMPRWLKKLESRYRYTYSWCVTVPPWCWLGMISDADSAVGLATVRLESGYI